MSTLTRIGTNPRAPYRSEKRLYLTRDLQRVVEHGHQEAAFLLVPAGGELTVEQAKKYGLLEPEANGNVPHGTDPRTIEQRETRVPKNLVKR